LQFPIYGDATIEGLFVRFLGDRALYERYCAEAHADAAEPDGAGYRLTQSERLALWIYTSTDAGWYERINGELWGAACSAEVWELSGILNAALAKFPPCNRIVYRGFRTADLDAFLATYGIGNVIRWPGFTSSTLDPEKAFEGNVLFTIRSQNGRILGAYADKPAEEEVLFPSGCRFLIVSLERREDVALIELDERP
jgi:hypothetical protein